MRLTRRGVILKAALTALVLAITIGTFLGLATLTLAAYVASSKGLS